MLTDTLIFRQAFPAKPGFQPASVLFVALAITAVFMLDSLTPLGIAVSFFYTVILLVALAWATPRQAWALAAGVSLLVFIGLFLSPGAELQTDLANRAITLITLGFLAYIGIAYRNALDTLYERERELTDLIENAPAGIHRLAPDGTILWANQQELDILGYDRAEYVGRNVADFHVDRKTAEDTLETLNANAPLRNSAARLRHKDGSIRHVLVSSNVFWKDGRFIHSQCFAQDITDRIRAELAKRENEQLAAANARLRESQERWSFSLRMSHTGGWDLDLLDHTAHRTLEHDRIFGYGALLPQWTYEQFLGHVLPEDRAEVDRRFRAATATQTEWNFECRIRRVDGQVRWIWAAGEHQPDAAGRTRRMTGIVQDITERKLAKQALRENKRRLRLAFEERERLSRDLHDNIIQSIYAIGMQLEACQRRPRGDPKDGAKQLAQAIRRLNGVIRDVRGYISGAEPQILSGLRLRDELAGLVEAVDATGTLRFRLNVDPWAVARLTPPQSEHILHIAREALSNGLRHSRARHGALSLQDTQTGVRFEIRDDGRGFDPAAARRNAGGLRNIEVRARQIGGRLEVLSSPGHGATLILHIPNQHLAHDVR